MSVLRTHRSPTGFILVVGDLLSMQRVLKEINDRKQSGLAGVNALEQKAKELVTVYKNLNKNTQKDLKKSQDALNAAILVCRCLGLGVGVW